MKFKMVGVWALALGVTGISGITMANAEDMGSSQSDAQETQIPGSDQQDQGTAFPGEATGDVQQTEIPGSESSAPKQDESSQGGAMGGGESSDSGTY